MNTHYLVKFEDNWADEIDISGFKLFEKDKWEELKKKILTITGEINIYFGSNEDNEYDNAEDLLSCFKTYPITSEQYNLILKLFPSGEF